MIYRSIKLVLGVLMLFILMSGLSITLAAPHAQATATPARTITATIAVTSTRQIGLLQCYEAYTVQPTDTLSKVAQRFYGAAVNFSVIIEATNAIALSDKTFTPITDTNRMKVGQKLCIINTPDLPIISRTATITVSPPPLTPVAQIVIPTSSPILNQPIAPSLKIGEQIIEVPEDKAALTVENLSPVDLVFDLIGPSEQSYVIGRGQKQPMIIQPGSHSFNIHAATGEVDDLPIAPGSFDLEVKQVAELIVFARSVEISKRNLGVIPTATNANSAPNALPPSATPALPATTATLPVVSTLPRNAITATNTPLATPTPSVKIATATQAPPPKATTQPAATSTSIPTTVATKTTTLQTTPAAIVTTISTKTATLQATTIPTTKTATVQVTATMSVTATTVTATIQAKATMSATTATLTKTATVQPTTNPITPTARPVDDAKKKLAPPEGQGRLYFQNFYRETATFTLNNQPITLEVEMIKMIDLLPATTSFQVSISRGAGQGQIDLAANTSWLVRLDPNGGLGWVQVYP